MSLENEHTGVFEVAEHENDTFDTIRVVWKCGVAPFHSSLVTDCCNTKHQTFPRADPTTHTHLKAKWSGGCIARLSKTCTPIFSCMDADTEGKMTRDVVVKRRNTASGKISSIQEDAWRGHNARMKNGVVAKTMRQEVQQSDTSSQVSNIYSHELLIM